LKGHLTDRIQSISDIYKTGVQTGVNEHSTSWSKAFSDVVAENRGLTNMEAKSPKP
jgi:hypothetical protein